ncbi:MAG: hypothetical protein B7X93_10625 [Hydrogenophilales bacterium 17-61-9]|nr:MAG: hypothetical protein B7X93_10625 [Hydrogenophilales bacterium 17-61-9]
MNEKIELHYQQGGSDKVYIVQLKETITGNYLVHCHYGRRGSTLNFAKKTPNPVSHLTAKTIFDRVVKEKIAKGYVVSEHTKVSTPAASPTPKELPGLPGNRMPQLLNPVREGSREELLRSNDWWAQQKMDGERRLVSKEPNNTWAGWNKKGEMVALSEVVVQALNRTPFNLGTLIDGEIIGDVYFPFDVLMLNGRNLCDSPLEERARALLDIQLSENIRPVGYFKTEDQKRALLALVEEESGEGLVYKRKDSLYVSGRPNSGGDQLKDKFVESATLVVWKRNQGKRSVQVGGYDGAMKLVELGSVTIPANHEVPDKGEIVEIRYLYAYKGGCLAQPVYLGRRVDQAAEDCMISQLKYKKLSLAAASASDSEDAARWAW